MSGIYIHIPFCKQACHYCDFYFSTSLKKKDELLLALKKELQLRKEEFATETITTLYFGGGTPSVLDMNDLQLLIENVFENYDVIPAPEITLEANPDDLDTLKIRQLAASPINRLSIGIQSFFEEDLQLMNRAHNATQAKKCLQDISTYFNNSSVDLIYGIPGMDTSRWQQNIEMAIAYNIPHISAYALTVEPGTALANFIKKGHVSPIDDTLAEQHFIILMQLLEKKGFIHYEISNFGKKGFFSKNNTAYWQGKKYIGIGPSAHSYNGIQRSWNINNTNTYIKGLKKNQRSFTEETLTKKDCYNEYIMTRIRTIWGISLHYIICTFGSRYCWHLLQHAQKHIENGMLFLEPVTLNNGESSQLLKTTVKGKFFSDGIASDLFLLNLP